MSRDDGVDIIQCWVVYDWGMTVRCELVVDGAFERSWSKTG